MHIAAGCVDHLVVVMMSGRSFDHYLGALRLVEGRSDVEGLTGFETNPGPGGEMVRVSCIDERLTRLASPSSGSIEVRDQWNGGRMDGFVTSYVRRWHSAGVRLNGRSGAVMGYYTRRSLPLLYALADEFAVCDHWFASAMGSGLANRIAFHTGECCNIDGLEGDALLRADKPTPVWELWERPNARGRRIKWKAYSADYTTLSLWPGFVLTHRRDHLRSLDDFEHDCREGSLPDVSLLEPPFESADDHPPSNPRFGQAYLSRVVHAVLRSQRWMSTAIVVTYDAHGGFYDHVAPPPAPGPTASALCDHYGLRVPALVISAWTPRGACVRHRFDHTSILATIAERWDLERPGRVRYARSLWDDCFDFQSPPRSAPRLPRVRAPLLGRLFKAESENGRLLRQVHRLVESGFAEPVQLPALRFPRLRPTTYLETRTALGRLGWGPPWSRRWFSSA